MDESDKDDWHHYLTDWEAMVMRTYGDRAEAIDQERRKITQTLKRIRNRCAQRRRRAIGNITTGRNNNG